jgi:cytochrome oxidase assembly protein ShyY1
MTQAGVARAGFPAGMSVFTLLAVIALIGLGVWQLQRRVEKHALIAALDARLSGAPVALPPATQWSRLTTDHDEFRRVFFAATFGRLPDAAVYTSGSSLRPDITTVGRFVFAPAVTSDGQTVVVDRGFVPEDGTAADAPSGTVTLTGYIRFPEKAGWLTPAPEVDKRLWFSRDPQGMAKALNWGNVAPFYVDLETPAPTSGLPRPGLLRANLPDNHLQYAITWFGLALAVAIAFTVWLRGAIFKAEHP